MSVLAAGPQRILVLTVLLVASLMVGLVALGATSDRGTEVTPPAPIRRRIASSPLAGGITSAGDATDATFGTAQPATLFQFISRPGMQPIRVPKDTGRPRLAHSIVGWEFRHLDIADSVVDWKAQGRVFTPLSLTAYAFDEPRLEFYRVSKNEKKTDAADPGAPRDDEDDEPVIIEARLCRLEMGERGAAEFVLSGGVRITVRGSTLRTEELVCSIEGKPARPQRVVQVDERGRPIERPDGWSIAGTGKVRIASETDVHLHRKAPWVDLRAGGLRADLALDRLALAPPVRVELDPSTNVASADGAPVGGDDAEAGRLVVASEGELELLIDEGGDGDRSGFAALFAGSASKDEGSDDGAEAETETARPSGRLVFRGGADVRRADGEFGIRANTLVLAFATEADVRARAGAAAPVVAPALGGIAATLAARRATPRRTPGTNEKRPSRTRPFFHAALAEGAVVLDIRTAAAREGADGRAVPEERWTARGDRLVLDAWPAIPRGDGPGVVGRRGRAVLRAGVDGSRVQARSADGSSWFETTELVVLQQPGASEAEVGRRVAIANGAVRARLVPEPRDEPGDDDATGGAGDEIANVRGPVLLEADVLEALLADGAETPAASDGVGEDGGRGGDASAGGDDATRRLTASGLERVVVRSRGPARPVRLATEDGQLEASAATIELDPTGEIARLRGSGARRPLLRRGDDVFRANEVDLEGEDGLLTLAGDVEGTVTRAALEANRGGSDGDGAAIAGAGDAWSVRAARVTAELVTDEKKKRRLRALTAVGHAADARYPGPAIVSIDGTTDGVDDPIRVRSPVVRLELAAGEARLEGAEGAPRPRIETGTSWIEADALTHFEETEDAPARALAEGEVLAEVEQAPRDAQKKNGENDEGNDDDRPSVAGRYRIHAAQLTATMRREDAEKKNGSGAGDGASDGAAARALPAVDRVEARGTLGGAVFRGPELVVLDEIARVDASGAVVEPTDPLRVRAASAVWRVSDSHVALDGVERGPRPRLIRGTSFIEADHLSYRDADGDRPAVATARGRVLAEVDLPEDPAAAGGANDGPPEPPREPRVGDEVERIRIEAARAEATFVAPPAGAEREGEDDGDHRPADVLPGGSSVPRVDVEAFAGATWPGTPAHAVRVTGLDADGVPTGLNLLADKIRWDHRARTVTATGDPARAARTLTAAIGAARGSTGAAPGAASEEFLLADRVTFHVVDRRVQLAGRVEAFVSAASFAGGEGDPLAALGGGDGDGEAKKKDAPSRFYWIAAEAADAQFEPPREKAAAADGAGDEKASGLSRLVSFRATGRVDVREVVPNDDPATRAEEPWISTLAIDADRAEYARDRGMLVLFGSPVRIETATGLSESDERFELDVRGVTGR